MQNRNLENSQTHQRLLRWRSADSASSQMMKTVSGFVSLRELLFYLRSTLAINAASFRTEENFNDRNFTRERELSISIVYVG